MSGKSRLSKQKHTTRSERKKGRQSPSVTVIQQQAVAPAREAVVRSETGIPSVSVPISKATPVVVQHLYISGELRRIGIMAGIILVILVALAQVLS